MLEEDIVVWVAERPDWQQVVVRRICQGETFTDEDINSLVDQLLTDTHPRVTAITVEEIPGAPVAGDPSGSTRSQGCTGSTRYYRIRRCRSRPMG